MPYNGWTNYETGNANLWSMNEEESYRAVMAGRPYTAESAPFYNAIMLKLYPLGTPDMSDIGSSEAYNRVNWKKRRWRKRGTSKKATSTE